MLKLRTSTVPPGGTLREGRGERRPGVHHPPSRADHRPLYLVHDQLATPQAMVTSNRIYFDDDAPPSPPLTAQEKVSPLQAAKFLGISRSATYRLIEQEKIEASKVGGRWVVYRNSLERLLAASRNDEL